MSDPTISHESYHHGDLRNALIAAGLTLLTDGDPAELSLRAVARHVGVSHTSVYRHFADKNALLAAIAEQGFLRLAERMAAEVQTAGSNHLARFTACATSYVAFAQAHPAHFRVMFSGWSGERTRHPDLSAAAEHSFGVLRGVVADAQAGGAMQHGDANLLALAGWSHVHGLATLLQEQQITPPSEGNVDGVRLARRFAWLLFYGLHGEG